MSQVVSQDPRWGPLPHVALVSLYTSVGKKNADLPRRKKKSAFQGRPAAAPRPPRKKWSPREVAAAIADEVGRNH